MLYQRNLAYQKEAWVNYDPIDRTVLANEQVQPLSSYVFLDIENVTRSIQTGFRGDLARRSRNSCEDNGFCVSPHIGKIFLMNSRTCLKVIGGQHQ